MNFNQPTIASSDENALEKSVFKAFLEKEMMIIEVIIGDISITLEATIKTNNLAQFSYFKMKPWVLWLLGHVVLSKNLKMPP